MKTKKQKRLEALERREADYEAHQRVSRQYTHYRGFIAEHHEIKADRAAADIRNLCRKLNITPPLEAAHE